MMMMEQPPQPFDFLFPNFSFFLQILFSFLFFFFFSL